MLWQLRPMCASHKPHPSGTPGRGCGKSGITQVSG